MNRLIKMWPVFTIIGTAIFAYLKGQTDGEARAQVACLEEKQRAIAQAIQHTENTHRVNQQTVDTSHANQANVKTEVQIIEKEVIRYVDKYHDDRDCDLDANRVQIINEHINAANSDIGAH